MIISFIGYKGGTGKTTTAVHLAALLQRRGDTILVDADPNRSALAWKERGKLPFQILDESEIGNSKNYTHLILDTPARPTPEEIQTIAAESDLLVIPSLPDALNLDALFKMIERMKELNATNYKVLFTQVPPRSKAGEEAKELLKEIGAAFFNIEIRRRAVCGRAALSGTTVNHLRDGGQAWHEFSSFGREVLKYGK